MKGCLITVIKIVILILAYIGFQSIGGVDFVKNAYNLIFNPNQEKLVEKAMKIVDLSDIDEEYYIDKTINILDYNMVLAEHKATGQKIAIIDPKKEDILTKEDFKSDSVNQKLTDLTEKYKYKLIRLDNFKITKKDKFKAMGQDIPFVQFEADTVNMPIGHINGIVGIATNQEGENIIISSINNNEKYSQIITEAFFAKVKCSNGSITEETADNALKK